MNSSDALNAFNFWMGIECLSPNKVIKTGKDAVTKSITWDIGSEAELPWRDRVKQDMMRRHDLTRTVKRGVPGWRYVAYAAVMPMKPVVDQIRAVLGAQADLLEEFRVGDPSAALAIPLDANGLVSDLPFIASLPWAMGRLLQAGAGEQLDFDGFFGPQNFQERMVERIVTLMWQRGVLARDGSEPLQAMMAGRGILDAVQRPLAHGDIEDICTLLFTEGGWRPLELVSPLRIKAEPCVLTDKPVQEPGDTEMLNSFFVEDINLVAQAVARDGAGSALRAYLTPHAPQQRIDLRASGDCTVEDGVMPGQTPLARWPSAHGGLVRAQQFAVNTVMSRLSGQNGMVSVNGPPGTGKTTLLRDIVAAIVAERAEAMAQFDDPLDAFANPIRVEGWKYGEVWELDARLAGNGIVVASANNGAVENITRELPGRDALPKDDPLSYLSAWSDSLAAGREDKQRKHGATWGAIAAVMGAKQNRSLFFERMRWSPKPVKDAPPLPHPLRSLWDEIEGARAALPWSEARARFLEALAQAREYRAEMQEVAELVRTQGQVQAEMAEETRRLEDLTGQLAHIEHQRDAALSVREERREQVGAAQARHAAMQAHDHAMAQVAQAEQALQAIGHGADPMLLAQRLDELQAELTLAQQVQAALVARRPGFWARLLRRAAWHSWQAEVAASASACAALAAERRQVETQQRAAASHADRRHAGMGSLEQARRAAAAEEQACMAAGISLQGGVAATAAMLAQARADWEAALEAHEGLARRVQASARHVIEQRAQVEALASRLGAIDADLSAQGVSAQLAASWRGDGSSDDDRQLQAPWSERAAGQAREALFGAALALQAAFIAAAWPRLKNTLSALCSVGKGELPGSRVDGGVSRLWESLFLVVPVVSTTFASFARMFKGWGAESIGWLLVDEAGQATPQQALGAIWRARRAVIVGDPLQLEPIVTLPLEALEPLRLRCGAASRFSPLNASAQVLADLANPFGTVVGKGPDATWVGLPLRVHRRCLDPMFSIANAIAYDGLMVYGAGKDDGDRAFGPSCWIDIPAIDCQGNNVPAQVAAAMTMAREFAKQYGLRTGDKANLYLITPFRDVNAALDEGMFRLFHNHKRGLHGTVHTFQGKEAEVVILVLGGDPKKPGLISGFAARKANLLNVAVTRAKKRLYVIGDRRQWGAHRYFSSLAAALPTVQEVPPVRPAPSVRQDVPQVP